MHTSNNLRLTGAALCGALFLSGCANQLPQRSEHEERIERKLLDHQLQIDTGEPKVLELPFKAGVKRPVKVNARVRYIEGDFSDAEYRAFVVSAQRRV